MITAPVHTYRANRAVDELRIGRRSRRWCGSAAVITVLMVACAAHRQLPASWAGGEVTNYRRLENGLATANAITLAAVPKLAAAGVRTIIDLRTPNESGLREEAAAAGQAGIRYVNIPVTPATLSAADIREVAGVLDRPENRPVLMHCSSGNRTGAVMELYREMIHGVDHDTARREAQTIGLQMPQVIEAVDRVQRQMESTH